jgi:inner membrane protein
VDNFTHTLAAMLLAETAVQARPRDRDGAATFRTAAYLASVFAGNAPDLDFLYARITAPPLGYLLHHRGHSHTLLAGIAIGVVTYTVAAIVARRRAFLWTRWDFVAILVLSCFGPLVHMAMDFSNNYGVHPFWPLYAGWLYGDFVFIVEPFFWAIAVPPLAFAAASKVTRLVLASALVLGLSLVWMVARASHADERLVPVPMAAAVTFVAIFATIAAWRASPRGRVVLGVLGSWTVAALFAGVSHRAASTMRSSPTLAGAVVHDVIITPMPANPLCATALVVATRGSDYIVARATVAAVPSWVPSSECPTATDGQPTAPRVPLGVAPTPALLWKDEFRAPLEELVDLARSNCQAAAFLRFARAPYWLESTSEKIIMGDLRYDRDPGLDFSDIKIAARPTDCPRAVPGWLPPRASVLAGASR